MGATRTLSTDYDLNAKRVFNAGAPTQGSDVQRVQDRLDLSLPFTGSLDTLIHDTATETVVFEERVDFSAQTWLATIQARLSAYLSVSAGYAFARVRIGGTPGAADGTEVVKVLVTETSPTLHEKIGAQVANPNAVAPVKFTLQHANAHTVYATKAKGLVTCNLAAPDAADVITFPGGIPNLVLRLDGAQVGGVDGDAIGVWADQSGNNNDASQATTLKKPILKKGVNGLNGLGVLRWDGTNTDMAGNFNPGSTGLTVFYVARTPGSTPHQYNTVLSSDGSGGTTGIQWAFNLRNSGDTFGAGWGGTAANIPFGEITGFALNTPFYARYRTDKLHWTVEGSTIATPIADTSFPTGTFHYLVGLAAFPTLTRYTGDIAEIVVSASPLSVSDMQKVKDYLVAKWGLY